MAMSTSTKRKRQESSTSRSTTLTSARDPPVVRLKQPSTVLPHDQICRRQIQVGASGSVPPRLAATPFTQLLQHPAQSSALMSSHLRSGKVLEEEDANDSLDHIILAIDIKEGDKVGCAYYIAREERLLCMEDVVGGGQDLIDSGL